MNELGGLTIILIFILIIFIVVVRLYYLFNKSNDKLTNTTTIIPFNRFNENCPSKIKNSENKHIKFYCGEYPMNYITKTCNQDNCSNYHFYKISQINKRFKINNN
jgi:hypothetical protein